MRFLNPKDALKELTYQDVFLLPRHSETGSRLKVDLRPKSRLPLSIPVIVANMNAVAGKRMTETITRRGGLVVLPQDKSFAQIKRTVEYVKHRHPVFETPIVLEKTETLQTALNLIHKRAHGAVFVVDSERKPVGIFTVRDAENRDLFSPLSHAMTRDLIAMPNTANHRQVYDELIRRRLNIMPIVDYDGQLAGVLTRKGAVRADIYQPAFNERGEFYTAVAVGINADLEKKVQALLEIGVDLIVLDTAHGHQRRMLDAIRLVRSMLGPDQPLAAGNIVTKSAAKDFILAGANILKVGVGPGAACTTRMMTGMGRPQFSAVRAVSSIAREAGVEVWADGGIKHPRDVVLALAAGATSAYIGSWFAGTYESPADIQFDEQGRMFKENFGMASYRAVKDRTFDLPPFEKAKKEFFTEGISHSKMFLKPGEESAEDIIDRITAGLRSACTYAGASDLDEFYQKVVVGTQTSAGYEEGKPVRESW